MLRYPGCAGWHGASYSNWVNGAGGFIRGVSGVFFFDWDGWAGAYSVYCGRGVAVVKSAVRAERVTDDLCVEAECRVPDFKIVIGEV